MPLSDAEKGRESNRNRMVEEMHQHDFKGAALTCGECGLAAADPFHAYVAPGPAPAPGTITETEGLRLQARNGDNVTFYRHVFELCESTGDCRECQLPLADVLHGVRGSASLTRNEDL